jgi:hypothetical protein
LEAIGWTLVSVKPDLILRALWTWSWFSPIRSYGHCSRGSGWASDVDRRDRSSWRLDMCNSDGNRIIGDRTKIKTSCILDLLDATGGYESRQKLASSPSLQTAHFSLL